jgi:hypothetical protein
MSRRREVSAAHRRNAARCWRFARPWKWFPFGGDDTPPQIAGTEGFFMSTITLLGERIEVDEEGRASVADVRACLRKRHALISDKLAALKALPIRTQEQREDVDSRIESLQFLERELDALKQ